MGIGNLTDLISSLYETGDYTKEEIEAYAEKAGFQGDFDSIYDKAFEILLIIVLAHPMNNLVKPWNH